MQSLQELNFAHDPLEVVLGGSVERDLLDCDHVTAGGVDSLKHLAVCAPPQLLSKLVSVAEP